MTKKPSARSIVIATLLLTGAAVLAMLFWPRPILVETATVRRGPIAETVSDQGQARVRQDFVVSAPVAGRLERLPLEIGDLVVAGRTVVARLRPASASFLDPRARAQAESNIEAASSMLVSAEAQRAQLAAEATRAAIEFDRVGPLGPTGAVSLQTIDNARAAADAARRAVQAADAQVRARRADLATARSVLTDPQAARSGLVVLTAPATGVVTYLLQQSERDVAAGAALIEIGAVNGLEAQIEFLSQDAVRIRPGQMAELYNWGGPAPIPAVVRLVQPQGYTKISALGVEEQRTLVMLQFAGPPSTRSGLQPGYRVWGRVILRESPRATIAPTGALVRDGGGWAVFRIEGGRARLRHVAVGAITDQDAEILQGLQVGDRLIDFPSDQVRDGRGIKVRIAH